MTGRDLDLDWGWDWDWHSGDGLKTRSQSWRCWWCWCIRSFEFFVSLLKVWHGGGWNSLGANNSECQWRSHADRIQIPKPGTVKSRARILCAIGQPMLLKLIPHGYSSLIHFLFSFPEELHRTRPRVRLPFLLLPRSPPPSPLDPHVGTGQRVAATTSVMNCGQWFLDAYSVYSIY